MTSANTAALGVVRLKLGGWGMVLFLVDRSVDNDNGKVGLFLFFKG